MLLQCAETSTLERSRNKILIEKITSVISKKYIEERLRPLSTLRLENSKRVWECLLFHRITEWVEGPSNII